MHFIFSVAQFNIIPGDAKSNFEKALACLDKACEDRSDLLILPELFLTGYGSESSKKSRASTTNYVSELKQIARQKHLYISGTYEEHIRNRVFNTLFLFSKEGIQELTYHKNHLFKPLGETKIFHSGTQLKSLQCQFGHIGAAICYDLRFSEMFVKLRAKGVNIFIIPAEWPLERITHWEALLVARAIEMQSFILASNCVGVAGDIVFGGQSMIVDPWGNIVCKGDSTSEGVFSAEIDTSLSDSIRSAFPYFEDRDTKNNGSN